MSNEKPSDPPREPQEEPPHWQDVTSSPHSDGVWRHISTDGHPPDYLHPTTAIDRQLARDYESGRFRVWIAPGPDEFYCESREDFNRQVTEGKIPGMGPNAPKKGTEDKSPKTVTKTRDGQKKIKKKRSSTDTCCRCKLPIVRRKDDTDSDQDDDVPSHPSASTQPAALQMAGVS